jgi:hypothetical protein
MLPGALEDDDLHLVVVHRPVEGRVEGIGHLGVLRVPELGAVHGHDRHRAPALVQHDLVRVARVVCHGSPPGFT